MKRLITSLSIAFVGFVPTFVLISFQSASADVNVSPGDRGDVSIVAQGETVYAAWEDVDSGKVFFDRSDDGGATWGGVRKSLGDGFSPQLALDKNETVYITWESHETNNAPIYFAKSTNRGANFTTPFEVGEGRNPYVESSDFGDYIYLIYHRDLSASEFVVFCRRSLDGGVSFEPEVQATYGGLTPMFGHGLAVSPDGQYVHVAFRGMSGPYWVVRYKRSTDYGQSFGPEEQISLWPHTGYAPGIAVYQNQVHVMFKRDYYGHDQIWIRTSTDYGATWPSGQWTRIDDGATKYTGGELLDYVNPSEVAIDQNGVIRVAFVDNTNGIADIYMDHSSDGGTTFGTDQRVDGTSEGVNAVAPSIAISEDGRNLYVAWQDDRDGGYDIYLRRYTFGGGGGGGGCFLSGTPILLPGGATKPIEELKVGDMVLAFDEKTNSLKKDKVKEFFEHEADHYLIINNSLKLTPNHPVYSEGDWIEIGELKVGDKLLSAQGEPLTITSIQKVKEKVKVYNLEVNPYHTYIAGGIVVHNKSTRIPKKAR